MYCRPRTFLDRVASISGRLALDPSPLTPLGRFGNVFRIEPAALERSMASTASAKVKDCSETLKRWPPASARRRAWAWARATSRTSTTLPAGICAIASAVFSPLRTE